MLFWTSFRKREDYPKLVEDEDEDEDEKEVVHNPARTVSKVKKLLLSTSLPIHASRVTETNATTKER